MRPIIFTAAAVLITAAVIFAIVASQRNAYTTSAADCDQGRGKVKVSTTASGNIVISEANPCQK